MQESYSERLAIYTGPESCGVVREDNVEALTGESAGRLFSRETPSTHRSTSHGNREILRSPMSKMVLDAPPS